MDISKILKYKFTDAQWTLNGDNYEGLTWLSETEKPSQEEIESLWPEVASQIQSELQAKAATKAALLERLGITAEEAALLLS